MYRKNPSLESCSPGVNNLFSGGDAFFLPTNLHRFDLLVSRGRGKWILNYYREMKKKCERAHNWICMWIDVCGHTSKNHMQANDVGMSVLSF